MQSMKGWLLFWLVFLLSHQPSACRNSRPACKNNSSSPGNSFCKNNCKKNGQGCNRNGNGNGCRKCCTDHINNVLKNGSCNDAVKAIEELQQILEEEEINGTSSSIISDSVVALQYKPSGTFTGLNIYASDNQVQPGQSPPSSRVRAQLPSELKAGPNNTIVFCMIKWPETNQDEVYDRRLFGLSVEGKKISGLQQRVNITVNLTTEINGTQNPSCQFLNFSTNTFSEDGCITLWTRGQNNLTCSCDHLTYFAVLMLPVSGSDTNATGAPSPKDQEILTYITLIGCSLSLFALVITVLLFITNRKVREDVSMKVHINLVIALILLNLHFLLTSNVAAVSSTGVCLYMALALHYSLLTTFSWMALEGFHLYLLLVKVFNIYIKRYLLKLSVVGWGVPAVIVSVVVIIHRGFYGPVSLDASKSNNTDICYITNDKVKMGTTLGPFILVFLFNMIMFAVTIRRVWTLRKSTEFGQSNCDRAKKDICTLLGVMTLLGITWGLVFFSFGYLTTPGLYLFCILNSLQAMLRRSLRLESNGYYDSQGERTISYKETSYRVFKRRRPRPRPVDDNTDRDTVDYNNDGFVDHSSDSIRGLVKAIKASGLLVLLLASCFGLVFSIGGLKMDSSISEVEEEIQALQREIAAIKKRMDSLLPVGDRMPNFALEELNAKIVKASESYDSEQAGWKLWGLTLMSGKQPSPSLVIQGRASMVPGACWRFSGSQGHLIIELPDCITISHVTLGHISKMVSPTGKISSAPRMFSVSGKKALDDSGVDLGTFVYDENGDPLQTFRIPEDKVDVIRYITLQVLTNWGNPEYTCVYNFRVHGKLA